MNENDPLLNLDPSEVVLHTVKRHPVGLVLIYTLTGLGLLANFGALFFLVRAQDNLEPVWQTAWGAVAVLFGFLIIVGGIISVFVYRGNSLVITNESVIQVLQQSLFDRKVSQLNLSKVQDVSVDQDGIIATSFNYGTINIESAGEAANYKFKYASNPVRNSKYLVEAHEQYLNELYEKRIPPVGGDGV